LITAEDSPDLIDLNYNSRKAIVPLIYTAFRISLIKSSMANVKLIFDSLGVI